MNNGYLTQNVSPQNYQNRSILAEKFIPGSFAHIGKIYSDRNNNQTKILIDSMI